MRIAAIAGALALVISAPAFADPGGPISEQFYVEATAGYSIGTDVEIGGADTGTDGGYMIGGALGYALSQGVSVEAELAHSSRDVENTSFSVDATSAMANVMMDFTVDGRNGGYIGGGIGGINVNIDTPLGAVDEWKFGYQFLAGVTREASENTVLFIEYRYQHANAIETAIGDTHYTGHTVGVGVRFGM